METNTLVSEEITIEDEDAKPETTPVGESTSDAQLHLTEVNMTGKQSITMATVLPDTKSPSQPTIRYSVKGTELPDAHSAINTQAYAAQTSGVKSPEITQIVDNTIDFQRESGPSLILPSNMEQISPFQEKIEMHIIKEAGDPLPYLDNSKEAEELQLSCIEKEDSEILKYDFLFEFSGVPSTSFLGYMGSLKEFLCENCKTVVLDTWMSPCSHQFCTACKRKATKDDRFKCYVDASEYNIEELIQNTADIEKLKHAEIFCSNRVRGCKEKFSIKNAKDHLDNCYYKYLQCPQNCGKTKILKDLGKHLTLSCERRVYSCECCEEDIPEKERQVHKELCKHKPILHNCNYCGSGPFEKAELDDHFQKCTTKPRPCKMNVLGCDFVGVKEQMDSHENLDNHAELIMNFIHRTKEAVVSLEQAKDTTSLQLSEALSRLTNIDLINRYLAVKVGILEEIPCIQKERSKRRWQKELEEDNKFLKQKIEELLKKQLHYEEQISRMAECCAGRPFEWVITNYSKKKDEEINVGGRQDSPPFYTTYCGYRMRLVAYLNGNGEGSKTHLSLYFCLMRGINDSVLDWPFRLKVTLQLVDRKHSTSYVKRSIEPKSQTVLDNSFQRPISKSNVGRGFPRFISHKELEATGSRYLVKDSIIIIAEFEPTDIKE